MCSEKQFGKLTRQLLTDFWLSPPPWIQIVRNKLNYWNNWSSQNRIQQTVSFSYDIIFQMIDSINYIKVWMFGTNPSYNLLQWHWMPTSADLQKHLCNICNYAKGHFSSLHFVLSSAPLCSSKSLRHGLFCLFSGFYLKFSMQIHLYFKIRILGNLVFFLSKNFVWFILKTSKLAK